MSFASNESGQVPTTESQFNQVMFNEFQGMDPELDCYYWNLWCDTLIQDSSSCWYEFLEAIALGKI